MKLLAILLVAICLAGTAHASCNYTSSYLNNQIMLAQNQTFCDNGVSCFSGNVTLSVNTDKNQRITSVSLNANSKSSPKSSITLFSPSFQNMTTISTDFFVQNGGVSSYNLMSECKQHTINDVTTNYIVFKALLNGTDQFQYFSIGTMGSVLSLSTLLMIISFILSI